MKLDQNQEVRVPHNELSMKGLGVNASSTVCTLFLKATMTNDIKTFSTSGFI